MTSAQFTGAGQKTIEEFKGDGAMMYHQVRAECSGELGDDTVYDGEPTDRPIKVKKLQFDFISPPNDALHCAMNQYIGWKELEKALLSLDNLTGIEFHEVNIYADEQIKELHPNPLPKFRWFKITGQPNVDDFGLIGPDVVVSDRVLEIIKRFPHKYLKQGTFKP